MAINGSLPSNTTVESGSREQLCGDEEHPPGLASPHLHPASCREPEERTRIGSRSKPASWPVHIVLSRHSLNGYLNKGALEIPPLLPGFPGWGDSGPEPVSRCYPAKVEFSCLLPPEASSRARVW